MPLGWLGPYLYTLEELEEAAGERKAWGSLLRTLPSRPSSDMWLGMDEWNG